MLVVVIAIFLLLSNWIFSEGLVFLPIDLFKMVRELGGWGLVVLLLVLLSWGFRD
ncbi:MAG: hypothetical protein HC890_11050 [Chloroflexaceae bacterium]|nr:hypothetical protein [Chloroflexaceae bacterium]